MDIVARLRQGGELMQSAADTIDFLRTEVDARGAEIERLGDSLNKCHAKLMRANCPVVDARNSEESV